MRVGVRVADVLDPGVPGIRGASAASEAQGLRLPRCLVPVEFLVNEREMDTRVSPQVCPRPRNGEIQGMHQEFTPLIDGHRLASLPRQHNEVKSAICLRRD